ncbi:MAG TPA: hypothetical protein VGM76_16770 [Lacipirellulaceae bacterium]|jgi:hypothetical protein
METDRPNPDNDPFGPPAVSTVVHCIHCGEEYDSYKIEWRIERDADGTEHGFWCCPIPGCDGMGFGFDIFPVDPEYRDENGELMWQSDNQEDFEVEEEDFDFGDALVFEDVEIESPSVGKNPPGESAGGQSEDVPF